MVESVQTGGPPRCSGETGGSNPKTCAYAVFDVDHREEKCVVLSKTDLRVTADYSMSPNS